MRRIFAVFGCLLFAGPAAVLVPAPLLAAQAYPTKPVRIVIGFPAGSQTDVIGRMLAQKMTDKLGQQVIVDNRPGAGGTIGAKTLLSANPDGHNLLMVSAAHAVHPTLYRNLPYDGVADFAGISQIASVPLVLVIAPSQGVRSVRELIALARQKPGDLTFGSAGSGSATHLAAEQFKLATSLNVRHVPYRGVPDALVDLVSSRIHYLFSPPTPAMPFISDGRLLALGVTTLQRSPLLPDVPTVAEAGVPGYELDVWFGMLASRKTPRPIIKLLNAEVARVLALPDIRERMLKNGIVPKPSTPEAFDAFVRTEVTKLGKVIKAAGAQIE